MLDCAAVAPSISTLSCLRHLEILDADFNSFSSMALALQQLTALTYLWLLSISSAVSHTSSVFTILDDSVEVLKSSRACMRSLKQLCLGLPFSLVQLQGMRAVSRGLSALAMLTLWYLVDADAALYVINLQQSLAGCVNALHFHRIRKQV